MNEEQLKEVYTAACESLIVPGKFLQMISGIVWNETISENDRLNQIKLLVQSAIKTY